MQIPVNKNIDTYKDDFFRGLTLQQTLTSVMTLAAAGGSFAFFAYVLHVPSSLSIYCALPFALPIAASGFFKMHGLSLVEWMQKKKKVVNAPLLVYKPYLVPDIPETECPVSDMGKVKKGKRILLVTDGEQYERSRRFEAVRSSRFVSTGEGF